MPDAASTVLALPDRYDLGTTVAEPALGEVWALE